MTKWMPALTLVLAGCLNVAGTEDLFICETCADGGGGSAGSCDVGEHEVAFQLSGGVVIEIEDTGQTVTSSTALCLPDGPTKLRASCAEEGNADVEWGNAVCPEESHTCDFTLATDLSFSIDGTDACD